MRPIPVGMIPTNALSPKVPIMGAGFFFGRDFMFNFDFHFITPPHIQITMSIIPLKSMECVSFS